MKRIIYLIIFSLIGTTGLYAQTTVSSTANALNIVKDGPKIAIDNIVHDFGVIAYNSPGSHIYVITNAGTEPLIITNCIKGCGCTAVDWTKDPIKPGERGMVKATYNTKKIGTFSRGVDVYSNDPNNPKINIRLKGTVENDPTITSSQTTNATKPDQSKW